MAGRPPKFDSPEELYARSLEYVELCEKTEKIAHVPGLLKYLDVCPRTWLNYQAKPDFCDHVKKVEAFIEASVVGRHMNNPIFSMFYLKNRHGWKDKQEIVSDNTIRITWDDDDIGNTDR